MVEHESSNGNQMKANEKSNESLTGEKRNKKGGLHGLQNQMM